MPSPPTITFHRYDSRVLLDADDLIGYLYFLAATYKRPLKSPDKVILELIDAMQKSIKRVQHES